MSTPNFVQNSNIVNQVYDSSGEASIGAAASYTQSYPSPSSSVLTTNDYYDPGFANIPGWPTTAQFLTSLINVYSNSAQNINSVIGQDFVSSSHDYYVVQQSLFINNTYQFGGFTQPSFTTIFNNFLYQNHVLNATNINQIVNGLTDLFTNTAYYNSSSDVPGASGTIVLGNMTGPGQQLYSEYQYMWDTLTQQSSGSTVFGSSTLGSLVGGLVNQGLISANGTDFVSFLYNLFASTSTAAGPLPDPGTLTASQSINYAIAEAIWNQLTNNNPPFATSDLKTLIQGLISNGNVTLTSLTPATVGTNVPGFNTLVQGFLSQASSLGLNAQSTSSDYLNAFLSYAAGANTGPVTLINSQGQPIVSISASFASGVPGATNYATTDLSSGLEELIQNSANVSGSLLTTLSTSQQEALTQTSFGDFLMYAATLPNTSSQDFSQLWGQNAMSLVLLNYPTTEISTSPTGSTVSGQQPSPPNSAMSLYQEVWDTFFPNNPSGFIPNLMAFIQAQQLAAPAGQPFSLTAFPTSLDYTQNTSNEPVVGQTDGGKGPFAVASFSQNNPPTTPSTLQPGYTPSGNLFQWFSILQQKATGTPAAQSTADGGFDQVQILFDIYALLLKMLNSLQIMTAAQAERQLFYTAYESAYTTAEAGIPYIDGATGGGEGTLGGYETGNANVYRRSDTAQMNSQFTSSVQAFRSEIESFAQQQNSAISQGQEGVSQEVNLAQSFIQESNTILQSMWH